jgi:hypothetical protein
MIYPDMLLGTKLLAHQLVIIYTWEIRMIYNDLELPHDRRTLNSWARSFFALDPDVHRIITQHALLLSNYYHLQDSEHQFANNFIKNMLDDLNVQPFINQILIEYFVIGEAFVYAELDESKGKWRRLFAQNPDYIVVKRSVIDSEQDTQFYLRPDENLRRMVLSDKEEDIKNCRKLNPFIVDCVKNGNNILLDNFHFSTMINKLSPYEIRGSSFLLPLLPLMKKREGTIQDTQIIRDTLFDINNLNNGVQKDALMQRYHFILNNLEGWLNKKIIAPIAKIHNFQKQNEDKQSSQLCFPTIKFDRIKLQKELRKIK